MAETKDNIVPPQKAEDTQMATGRADNLQSTVSAQEPGITFPVKPESVKNIDSEALRRRGIDADTYERKAVTYKGLIEEFGKPKGPRLYNAIAVAAFGGVQPWLPALSIITLEDRWISPRTTEESAEDFAKRLKIHGERRAKVQKLLADAEGGVE